MSRILLSLVLLLLAGNLIAQTSHSESHPSLSNQERYIRNYAPLAVEEMYYSGIPSSIKLAQGILESGAGQSRLSVDGANHFGIKCKSYWQGDTLLVKDDDYDKQGNLLESCFRRYESPLASYRDHSEFLITSPRYAELFQLDRTDYQGWARGLQRCGYATSQQYAQTLISLVERYQLHIFDRVPQDDIASCLDYYETHLYADAQGREGSLSGSPEKPRPVKLPRNYKGGWLRENTRIRLLTTLLDQGGAERETVRVTSEGGFLAFEVSGAGRPE
jgi:hypothetical protein